MTIDVFDRVRRRIVESGESVSRAGVAAAVRTETGSSVGPDEVLDLLRAAESEFVGAGLLEPLLRDPDTTDVLVNGPAEVWIDRGSGLERAPVRFPDEEAVRRLAQRLAAAARKRLDDARPWVDGTLPDGTRLHAILPPLALHGTCLSLRSFRPRAFSVADLVAVGTLTAESAQLAAAVVRARLAFLVTGGTGSGKTTLLSTLLGLAEPTERLLLIEDAPELRPEHGHVVRLTTRASNVEGAGEVTLRDLVRQSLRMRPDRLVVGEVRGAEVVDLLTAFNTGHDGGAGTVHANSAVELPARLEALGALGGLERAALHSLLAASIQVALHLRRSPDGLRTLAEIGLLRRSGDVVSVIPAWRADSGPAAAWGEFRALLAACGSLRGGQAGRVTPIAGSLQVAGSLQDQT
jgi:pilus assembly protein CpaF